MKDSADDDAGYSLTCDLLCPRATWNRHPAGYDSDLPRGSAYQPVSA